MLPSSEQTIRSQSSTVCGCLDRALTLVIEGYRSKAGIAAAKYPGNGNTVKAVYYFHGILSLVAGGKKRILTSRGDHGQRQGRGSAVLPHIPLRDAERLKRGAWETLGMRNTDNAAESRWFTQSPALACTTDIHDGGMSTGIQVWT